MNRFSAALMTVVATVWVAGAGLVWGTHVAGGADSYGYVSQAELWLDGDLIVDHPFPDDLDWPDIDATLTPLGYRPGPRPGTIVPVYPAGLPIVMALFQALGGPPAVFWVVPVLGAILVLASAGLAYRLAGPTAAAVAAVLLAVSPTLLFSVTWPMSDVPAAAWWALTLFWVTGTGTRSAWLAGGAAALAILTRPNLVGTAIVPFVYLLVRVYRGETRCGLERLVAFSVLAAAGSLAVAAIHTVLYGSPLESGYGRLGDFIDVDPAWQAPGSGEPTWLERIMVLLARPLDNIQAFVGWLLTVESAMTVLAGLGVIVVALGRSARSGSSAMGWLCVGFAVAVLASYFYFIRYPEWWLLRLLLPAYPALAVVAGTAVAWSIDRVWRRLRAPLVAVFVGVVTWVGLTEALDREVHYTWINESRYEQIGTFVANDLPPNAVVMTFQQSGSLRYYTHRPTVRFDILHGHWLERATMDLEERGYAPYFLIEDHELELFRNRFGFTPMGALDWPPRVIFDGPVTVSLFDPADYWRGRVAEPVATRQRALERVTVETGLGVRWGRIPH